MKDSALIYLPWLLSAITLLATLLQGQLNKNAWAVGLLNQALWFLWTILSKNYGFLPLNIGLTVLYFWNHYKWNK